MRAPDPLMLRVYKGDKKGATAFFRNRAFLNTIGRILLVCAESTGTEPKVFFHACSIGAEPYSFAAFMLSLKKKISIDATDIEPDFEEAAKKGVYPRIITDRMTHEEKNWFKKLDNDYVTIDEAVRACVNFIPVQSLHDPIFGEYDVVFAMNVLTYLPIEGQASAIRTMAASARKYLCLTAFHPDTIRADLENVGFEPVMDNQKIIHNSWGDRVRQGGAAADSPEYSWVVPPYNTDCDDYAWRYCSIFKRKSDVQG